MFVPTIIWQKLNKLKYYRKRLVKNEVVVLNYIKKKKKIVISSVLGLADSVADTDVWFAY